MRGWVGVQGIQPSVPLSACEGDEGGGEWVGAKGVTK